MNHFSPDMWSQFNPAYQVARCGDWNTHRPHIVDHGPDQPRNCPGTGKWSKCPGCGQLVLILYGAELARHQPCSAGPAVTAHPSPVGDPTPASSPDTRRKP